MQIGVADAARKDLDEDLARPGVGIGTSSMVSGLPKARTTAAFIVLATATSSGDRSDRWLEASWLSSLWSPTAPCLS
jgi:hypothetical protein